jgi:putative ABC transport system permease protein
LDQEIQFHLDLLTEANLRSGMSPEAARSAARRSFGAVEPMKEQYRSHLTFDALSTLAQDVRYALRTLRKSTGYTAAAVTTLAVAIGANTAVLSVVNAVLFRPMPYHDPEKLVMLWTESPSDQLHEGRTGYWNIEAWRQSQSFAGMAVFDGVSVTLADAGRAERITAARISADFFSVLGVQPAAGRMFTAAEAEQRRRVLLVSHAFWQSHFAGSPDTIGAQIELDGIRSEVIGVLPAGFHFPKLDAQIWEPYTLFPDWDERRAVRGVDTWSVTGRLRAGITIDQAQAEMTALAHGLEEQLPPTERHRGIRVMPLSRHVVGERARLGMWMLATAVICVLLIAVTNVASLALARGISRTREFAIRAALGASQFRIIRQLTVESTLLAVMAGTAGTLLAWVAIRLPGPLDPDILGLPIPPGAIVLEGNVPGVALALSLFTGWVVGLAPATILWRRNLDLTPDSGRSIGGSAATQRLRRTLVAGEFALAIVLLFSAGLFLRSWRQAQEVATGFQPEGVVTVELRTAVQLPPPQRGNFYRHLLDEVAALPGVEKAGFSSDLFISSTREQVLTTEAGARSRPERVELRRDEVSPDFFMAAGTPLLAGRFFSHMDGPEAPPAVIINDALARRLWPSGEAVGRRFKFGSADSDGPWFNVVGVVADMRRQGAEREPVAQIFESLAQNPSAGGSLVVRTALDDPLQIVPAIQLAVSRIDPLAPVSAAKTLEAQLAAFLLPRRFQTALLAAFSAIALLLAAVGIYGLIQYSVVTRTKEIGVRMALGAQCASIFRMILGEGLKLAVIGLALGIAAAIPIGRAASSLLFGISGSDPLSLAAGVSLLLCVSVLASCLPARRAMNIEPLAALRDQ